MRRAEVTSRPAPRRSVQASKAPVQHRGVQRPSRLRPDPEIQRLLSRIGHHADIEINVVPMGEVGDAMPALHALEDKFPLKYRESIPIPRGSLVAERRQYRATSFISALHDKFDARSLGLTHVDIFEEKKNFIFGLAETQGIAAVISTRRLRHDARSIYWQRVRKEAVHEIGHLLGLHHCHSSRCVMYFSTDILDTDNKGEWFCAACSMTLARLHLLEELRDTGAFAEGI
jgi:archaemetzincin